jgi:hypothetical protein
LEEQENELKNLKALRDKNNLGKFINLLRNAKAEQGSNPNSFRMISPIVDEPDLFIDFVKYPNEIWKIEEI